MANSTPNSNSDDLLKAMDAPSSASEETPETSDLDDDKKSGSLGFFYRHPLISMLIFYIVLTFLAKYWNWAAIIFLAIPFLAMLRIYTYSFRSKEPIYGKRMNRLFWWSRLGFYSFLSALIAVVLLEWLSIINIIPNQ